LTIDAWCISKQELELLSEYLDRLKAFDSMAVKEARKIVNLLVKIEDVKVAEKLPTIEV